MVKKNKKPKDYTFSTMADEDSDPENLNLVTDENGQLRTLRPDEHLQYLVGDSLAAALAADVTFRNEYLQDLKNDEENETGHEIADPTYSVGQQVSGTAQDATKVDPVVPPTYSVGATGETRRDSQASPAADDQKSRSSSKTSQPTDPRKKKHAAKIKQSSDDELTQADLASLKQQYTIELAKQWRFVETAARTDADFRKELLNFYQNWRELNRKAEGTTPNFFTEPWKTHKIGRYLYERYRKYRAVVRDRELFDRRGLLNTTVVVNMVTTTQTKASSSTDPSGSGTTTTTATTTTTSTSEATTSGTTATSEQTTSSSMEVTSSSADTTTTTQVTTTETQAEASAMEVVADAPPAAQQPGFTEDEAMEFLQGTADLNMAVDEAAQELLSPNYDGMLDEEDLEEDLPAPQLPAPTYSVGAEGEESSVATYSVAPAAGNAAEESIVEPVRAGATPTSSGTEERDRSRQSSTKRAYTPSGTSVHPPTRRGRRDVSLSPERLAPGIKRHRERRAKNDKPLIPIIDPRVYKDSAIRVIQKDVPFIPWIDQYKNLQWEYLGYINAFQVPWVYLATGEYDDPPGLRATHTLRDVEGDMIFKEDVRLPNDLVLGHTFGVDPLMWKMVSAATRERLTQIAQMTYWEPTPGLSLRVVGIGPTGFNLSKTKDYRETFDGQRGALVRIARAAKKSGKCLSLQLLRDGAASDFDIHGEARDALREIGLDRNHPIHLENFAGTYDNLCDWLDQFPNTVIALDYRYLDNLETVAEKLKQSPSHELRDYLALTVGLIEFIKHAPLDNLIVQSGAYNPTEGRILRQPGDPTAAITLFERMTGTAQEVILERSALNSARIYRLEPELFDRAERTEDRRQPPRSNIATLRRTIQTELLRQGLYAPPPPPGLPPQAAQAAAAPRADQDQREASRAASTDARGASTAHPTYSVGEQPGTSTGAVAVEVLSIPPRSHSASPREPKKGDDAADRRSRSPVKKQHIKAKKVTKTEKDVKARSSSLSSPGSSGSSKSGSSSSSSGSSAPSRPASKEAAKSKRADHTTRSRSRSTERSRRSSRHTPPSSRHSRHSSHRSTPSGYHRDDRHDYDRDTRRDSDRTRDKDRRHRDEEDRRHRDEEYRRRRDEEDRRRRDDERRRDEERRDRDRRGRQDPHHSSDRTSSRDKHKQSPVRREEHRRDRDPATRRDPSHSSKREPKPTKGDTPASSAKEEKPFAIPKSIAPQGRPPIKAPSPPAQSEPRTSSASSRTSSTKRTHESGLQGRVTMPKAGAPAYSADVPAQGFAREQRHPTYSVGALQPLRRTMGDDLLKARALPPRYLLRPSEEELESYVANCFADEILDQRLQLRTVHVEELSSTLIDPPQTEHFAVPPEQSWNPCHRCEEDEDTNTFHMTVDQANYVPVKRWQTNPDLQDAEMIETLRALGEMRIYSFGHMILVTWAVHLYFPDQRIRAIVTFLYRLLQTHDWERRIPELLHEFQPQMIDEDTTAKWPTSKNLKYAADRWVCCCRQAFKYLFDHLTGPIEFHPRWLQSEQVPAELRRDVRDHLIGQAELIISNLRHLIYRQYGLQHFHATLERKTLVWKRLEKVKKRETTRNGLCLNYHTIVFAEKPVYDVFLARTRPTVFMAQVPEGDREYLRRFILNYFPGPDTRRVVFWIGRNYIVNGNRDDYDELIQDLCQAYAAHCGYVEQVVILPPYLRTHRGLWSSRALRLLVQQREVLPHARVVVCPKDLQLYDRDCRLGARSIWQPTFAVTEDGRYQTADTVEARKSYLRDEHDLDLWEQYVELDSNAPKQLLNYEEAPAKTPVRKDATYSVAPPLQPTTSANIATPPSSTSGQTVIRAATKDVRGAPPAIVQPTPGPSTSAAALDPAQLIQATMSTLFQQQQQSNQQIMQTLLQMFVPATTATAETAPPKDETKSSRKDHHKDRRE